ncbi:MAG TPA: radical SAM protein [Pseudonocardiaceae bacterium]|jgi:MoaA/NifB/PqqE/SkfB family radical SAM enzyme
MNAIVDVAHRFLYAEDALGQLCTQAVSDAPAGAVRWAVLCHLAAPSTPAQQLADILGTDLDVVRSAYRHCRESQPVSRLIGSWFYPHRLRYAFAAATVQEWRRVPDRPARILARQPVLGETMEIHPTRGTCNYGCAMCLWSDQQTLTYQTKHLDSGGLMTAEDWCRVLAELHDQGVRRLIVSGGGEALINPQLPDILTEAGDLGFELHIYTTGFSIRPATALLAALLRCHRIRFSIHSPEPVTYDRIAGTRAEQHALDRVTRNLVMILTERGESLQVGIGFVIQPYNFQQLETMVEFAEDVGVDWLDLRKDEVDVTEGLTGDQLVTVREQLRSIRYRPPTDTRIDIGDELVSLANGQTPDRTRTAECLGRYFRPTIGAYGHLTPCDLKAEPRFSDTRYDLGSVKKSRIMNVVSVSSGRRIPDDCAQCMPSSRTGNAIVHKLLADLQAGVGLTDQPFA